MTLTNEVETFDVNFEAIKPRKIETPDDTPWLFGGLDLAKRVHSSAFESFQLTDEGILEEYGFESWEHTRYGIVAEKVQVIHEKHPHQLIGFDRSGVGDAAIELFDTSILPMTPIVTTQKMKIDIVNCIEILRDKKILKFKKNSPVPRQLEGQQEKRNKETNTVSYPHGSVPNDSLWAAGYAIIPALQYLIHSGEPFVIRTGDSLHYPKQKMDIDNELARMMNQDTFGENFRGSADKMRFLRNYKRKF